ncbi:hypothetical protein F3Y22_tig00110472pilonHSYRG00492 [Hibiscus syriacus]|uniref:Disease resistance RPP13-like protein 1 n=1 Tax=Hibiscus syriacus TaxID=106335 RepID=A0A6A3AFT7_HIBSY|nr:hypothetical protein F3Y22_tig00110472pilonHSYRG00492 [Hibiscus syriacus]
MAFIGEATLSKLSDLLLGKSIDAVLNFVADHKQLYDQLKEWKSILPDIKAVLNHAEEKQIKDEGVKSWLEDLQYLAYDADDILDDFAYEQLRLNLHKTQAQVSTSKKPTRLQPTSVVDGTVEYVGRDNEKQEMLDLLKTINSDGVCVLTIVGMGGMGKTTLAQLVYKDACLKEYFDHRAWICVSEDFDAV